MDKNIYDLLRTLIRKATWSDEGEQLDYIAFVDYCEQLKAFGDRMDIPIDTRKEPYT